MDGGHGSWVPYTRHLHLTRVSRSKMNWQDRADAFMGWLRENEAFVSGKIALHDYSSEQMGTGMISLDDIKKGEVLFTIPRSLLLSRHSSKYSPTIKSSVKNHEWNQLIWAIILEHRDLSSFWRPYLDMIPKDLSTALSWSLEEKELFRGSSIYRQLFLDVDFKDKSFFSQFMTQHRMKELCTEREFYFAGSLISAYSFLEDPDDTTAVSMVPLADMLNHSSSQNNARLFFKRSGLQMVAIRDIKAGEQLHNTFGERSNGELLLKYGFVESDNRFNRVDIDLEDFQEFLTSRRVLKKLRALEDSGKLRLPITLRLNKVNPVFPKLLKMLKVKPPDLLNFLQSRYPADHVSTATTQRSRMAQQLIGEEERIIRFHLETYKDD